VNIPAKKLVVITVVGALITITLERAGFYDAIVKALS
jgi:hypothetical protein